MAITATHTAAPSSEQILTTIRDAIDDGRDLMHVERAVLGPLALDGEHRDALWLYAWAYHARGGAAARGARPG